MVFTWSSVTHYQEQSKVAKSGEVDWLIRKYFYRKKLKFYGVPLKLGGAATP